MFSTQVVLIGAGKASYPMAEAAMAVLGDHIARGCVVTKYDHLPPVLPCGCKRVEFREAAHPVPDEASVSGTNAIRKYVR